MQNEETWISEQHFVVCYFSCMRNERTKEYFCCLCVCPFHLYANVISECQPHKYTKYTWIWRHVVLGVWRYYSPVFAVSLFYGQRTFLWTYNNNFQKQNTHTGNNTIDDNILMSVYIQRMQSKVRSGSHFLTVCTNVQQKQT